MSPRYSIVVVSYNCLANLQACLEAVQLCFAAEPYQAGEVCGEIVVVDNASRDGTGAWLGSQNHVLSILNPDNKGFSVACNQGAKRARGEFVLFLNPDTWATPGCLGRMLRQFDNPRVGAVGPVSNYVAGLQRLDIQWPPQATPLAEIPGSDGRAKANAIARELARYRTGQGTDTLLLIGFCLMMRRSGYEEMGGMDEDLFLGNDDLDLSWRLREKGMSLRIAIDAFVLHEGQKSFKTERKETVDTLVQQSTDALYRKLVRYYGSPQAVPSPRILWGMDWFHPSAAALEFSPTSSTDQGANMPHPSFLTDVTLLLFVPEGEEHEKALAASLIGLPKEIGEILLIDARVQALPVSHAGQSIRRLDVGADMPVGLALRLAARASHKSYLLCLPAGLQVTALFSHWLAHRDAQALPVVLPLRVSEEMGLWPASNAPFLIQREMWLREPPAADADWQAVSDELRRKTQGKALPSDAPWLACSLYAMRLWGKGMVAGLVEAKTDWTPVAQDTRIALYPPSLQPLLQKAKQTLFTGTAVSGVTVGITIRGIDMNGNQANLDGQDLIVVRLTPDMLTDLPERLRHIRRNAPQLQSLVVVFNGNHATGAKADDRGWHTPIDLTLPGVTSALCLSGFSVVDSKAYEGFPEIQTIGGPLKGWHQIEAVPRPVALHLNKKVSIVLLGFNQVEYTRKCLESIRKYTRQRYELILVDNGSQDGTWDLFQNTPGAKTIRHEKNLGVSAGWNSGLRKADGDYVCILNNDTLVGDGWLENMIRLCESDAKLGLVGPRCNRIAGSQVVETISYRNESEIPVFISKWNDDHALQSEDQPWIKGVCMVLPKRVVDQVGFFDERFGKGNFEDDDYSLRVRMHGFRTCIAHDSYLHHFGSVSFNQEGIDWSAQMRRNKELFDTKWARGRAALNDVTVAVVETSHVLDAEIAARLNRVQQAYDQNDIPQARKYLLEAAALNEEHPEVLNAMGIFCFHDGDYREAALCFIKTLIRVPTHDDAGINLLDALKALNGEVSEVEMQAFAKRFPGNKHFMGIAKVNDWRYDVELCIASEDFPKALQMLQPYLMEDANTRSTCFNYMGIIAHLLGETGEAIEHFYRALAEPHVERDAVLNATEVLLSQGKWGEAVGIITKASQGFYPGVQASGFNLARLQAQRAGEVSPPDTAKLRLDLEAGEDAEKLLESGRPEEAKAMLQAHLKKSPEDFRAHNNLGLCAYYSGNIEAAFSAFERALQCEPRCGDVLINVCDCALALGRSDVIPEFAKATLRSNPHSPEAKRIERLLVREGEALRQAGTLAEIESQHELVDEAEGKLRQGDTVGARRLYEDALQRRSANPQALNGLGLLAFGEHRYGEAYRLFQEAAHLNTADQDILINLWESARAERCENEALGLLRASLDRNPGLSEVRAIVTSVA